MEEKMYIWGAGECGTLAINYFGKEKIKAIIDNNPNKQGLTLKEIRIISFEDYMNNRSNGDSDVIMICVAWENVRSIQEQLKENGISDYKVFNMQLFEDVDLIYNQYEKFEGVSEDKWNENLKTGENINKVREYVEKHKDSIPWPHEIEIETINRCNGGCSFCPVNVNKDIRRHELMDEELFLKIVDDLKELDYAGRVALFSNNEPLLDDRIIEFSRILRERVPRAQIHMFTNGTLLTVEMFRELINYLDELIIDNYNQQLQLISSVKKIKTYIDDLGDPNIRKKVKILLRKPNEFLSSRGGDAPNRMEMLNVSGETCALPLCQMVIRPSGKVSLCCNDPYGKDTLGDLKENSILEVWYGEEYQKVRNEILKGRENYQHCEHCDTFMII